MSKRRSPYENQVIGAFIYALGFVGGQRAAGPMPVNLFQQTPLDKTFGDLVVGSTHCLVIEFKREALDLASERKKWTDTALRTLAKTEKLLHASWFAHRVVYARPAGAEIELRYCHYLDVLKIKNFNTDRGSAQILIDEVCGAARGKPLGAEANDVEVYLRWMAALKTGDADERKASSSAWLAVAQSEHGLQYLAAGSLAELLRRTHEAEVVRERRQDRDLER